MKTFIENITVEYYFEKKAMIFECDFHLALSYKFSLSPPGLPHGVCRIVISLVLFLHSVTYRQTHRFNNIIKNVPSQIM